MRSFCKAEEVDLTFIAHVGPANMLCFVFHKFGKLCKLGKWNMGVVDDIISIIRKTSTSMSALKLFRTSSVKLIDFRWNFVVRN